VGELNAPRLALGHFLRPRWLGLGAAGGEVSTDRSSELDLASALAVLGSIEGIRPANRVVTAAPIRATPAERDRRA